MGGGGLGVVSMATMLASLCKDLGEKWVVRPMGGVAIGGVKRWMVGSI